MLTFKINGAQHPFSVAKSGILLLSLDGSPPSLEVDCSCFPVHFQVSLTVSTSISLRLGRWMDGQTDGRTNERSIDQTH